MLTNKRRPYLIHFHSILVKSKLSIRLGISSRPSKFFSDDQVSPSIPIRDFRLLGKNKFTAKIIIQLEQETIYEKTLDTDQFGHLNHKVTLAQQYIKKLANAQVYIYEISMLPGIDLFMGKHVPTFINIEKPVIISDFDKTLVDTKYKTTVELYHSLTSPLKTFPTVQKTLDSLMPMIKEEIPFFIVSASPHFYENPIRNWLLENKIKDSGIFLKDYRHFLSFQNTELFSKDIKVHGTFKLSQLLNLIYMLEGPKTIILFGDNSETDPLIYCLFDYLVTTNFDIQSTWQKIKQLDAFKLTQFQDSKLLNRLHLIRSLKKHHHRKCEVKINIRLIGKSSNDIQLPYWLETYRKKINFY